MAHCCVGYLFDGHLEDGGDGFLISCDRCASFKMPLRNSYHSSRDADSGKLKFKGNAIKHKKGEPYLVDCNVTGSDVGTATKPCFPLLNLWKYTLVPAIAQLLAPGAPCEGAQVIVQQDNAGPHVEEVYSAWMLAMFDSLGWMYEPQAPQGMSTIYMYNLIYLAQINMYMNDNIFVPTGPYTNVLDLYLFPSMSHRHSAQLQRQSNTELPLDVIWKCVDSVWTDTISAEVVRSCI
jgi:hypothetical protein